MIFISSIGDFKNFFLGSPDFLSVAGYNSRKMHSEGYREHRHNRDNYVFVLINRCFFDL
jgi:hypothetical protein